MKKEFTFSKKLAAYSVIAAAGITAVNGQVVYTDVNPDVTFNPMDSVSLDIDGNATPDYYIKFHTFSTATNDQLFMAPLVNGNQQMGSSGWASWNWYGSALNLNDPINSSGAWVCPGGIDSRSRVFFASTYGGSTYGNFADGTDHYMGIQFDIAGSTHYGWVRVNVASDVSNIVLKDFAYESTAQGSILAGATVTNIEQDVINSANIFAYEKQVTIELSEQVEGSVRIYNAIGQEVYSDNISDVNMIIDMPTAQAGIYTVVIESNSFVTQKKINL